MADAFPETTWSAPRFVAPSNGGSIAAPSGDNGLQQLIDPMQFVTPLLTPNSPDKTFVRKSAEDVLALGATPAHIVAHPVQTVKDIPGALVSSVKQTFDPKFYDEHPVLATINTLANISIVGGLALDATGIGAVAGVPLSLFGLAVRGVTALVEKEAVDLAVETGVNSARTAVVTALPKSTLHTMTASVLKDGGTQSALDMAKASLIKKGVEPTAAASIAQRVTDAVVAGVEKYKSPLQIANAAAHPLKTAFSIAGKVISPAAQMVFGAPEKSAVSAVLGTDVVKSNPVIASSIEDYADRYSSERGWKPGVDSRIRAMNEWSQTNPLWAAADPAERLKMHENFIKADTAAVQAARLAGQDIVPVKFISPNDFNSMVATIKDASEEEFAYKIGSNGTRETPPILKVLQDIHGSDFGHFAGVLKQAFEKTPTREGLMNALNALRKGFTLSYPKGGEVERVLSQATKDTGYNFSIPPTSKPISHTAEAEAAHPLADAGTHGATPNTLTAEEASSKLVGRKTQLGQFFQKFGLSTAGTAEGSIQAAFADNFAQGIIKALGDKFPDGIRIPDNIKIGTENAVTYRTIPLNRIYQFLNKITGAPMSTIVKNGLTGEIKLGGISLTRDLKIPKETAQAIYDTANSSIMNIPFEKTGIAEGVANILRAKLPGYKTLINQDVRARYNWNPAFGIRTMFKMNVLGFMDSGKAALSVGTGIESTLRRVPYVGKLIAPAVDEADISLMNNEIFNTMENKPFDAASNPEVIGLAHRLSIKQASQSSNLILKGMGYDTESHAVRLAGAIAEKNGLTLREALGSQTKNGMKIYDYPSVFQAIKEAQQAVFHYKAGVLTSPLMRTLNVIWYPLRFETKVVEQTAKFLGNLSPSTKLVVMSSITHFANFIQTPEGVQWAKDNNTRVHALMDYLLPYNEIGHTISSVMQGKLFDGNTGLLGGVPFGIFTNILNTIGAVNTNYGALSPDTGKPYPKELPKHLISDATAIAIANDILTYMLPSIPTTKLLGGGEPLSKWLDDTLIQAESVFVNKKPSQIHKEMKKVKGDYEPMFQPGKIIKDFFTPGVAEASTITPGERIKVASSTVDKVGTIRNLAGGAQVRDLSPNTTAAIDAAYKRYPDLPKGLLQALYAQESSFGTNRTNVNNDQGAYGWMVGFTKGTFNDIKSKADAGDPRYVKLLKQLDFSSKGKALRSAAAYLDFRSKRWLSDGTEDTTKRMTDAVRLYSARYNGGGAGADFDSQKFKDLVDYYSV